MILGFIILLGLMIDEVVAQIPAYCDVGGDQPISKIRPRNNPDYFFKASPDGRYIYYISNKKNYRIDTYSTLEEQIPGSYDPVISPDEKILSHLNDNFEVSLTPIAPNRNFETSRTFSDKEKRTYQSLGVSHGTYRLFSQGPSVNGNVSWTYRDFILTSSGITPKSSAVNIPMTHDTRLAMLNKRGNEFVMFNASTGLSEIRNYKGELVQKIPVGGGKGDFSYDNSKVAFHLTLNVTQEERSSEIHFGPIQIQNTTARNIFIFDRKSASLKQVTNFTHGSAFFPIFLGNGNLLYLYKDSSGQFEFHQVREPSSSRRSISQVEECMGTSEASATLSKMVQFWQDSCSHLSNTMNEVTVKAAIMNMPKEYCLDLALRSGLSNIKANTFCDPTTKPKIEKPDEPARIISEGQTILSTRCAICHTDIPFHDKKAIGRWKDKIIERINHPDPSKRMPLGTSLTPKEIQYVQDFLK